MMKTIVFDFGGVLIDWNPRHLYRKIFENEEEMEWFLENVCTADWNAALDEGHSYSEAVKKLSEAHPKYKSQIEAYHHRWPEMVIGEIAGSVEILREIQAKNYRVFGLTNWSSETFPIAFERFSFLSSFDGIVVSGDERLIKPNREIFELLLNRYNLAVSNCIFIDDSFKNIQCARSLGFEAIHFTSPENLRSEMEKLGVL